MDELIPGVAPHTSAPESGPLAGARRWASAPAAAPIPPVQVRQDAGPGLGSPAAPPNSGPSAPPGPVPPVAHVSTAVPTLAPSVAPPAPAPAPAAPSAYGAPAGTMAPPMPAAPTHQPVPGLAPDLRGADVGLAPENPSLMPVPEVRIAESEAAAYARISSIVIRAWAREKSSLRISSSVEIRA